MGGGEARLIYLAWRYGGADPFQVYNGLREDYRPIEGGEPVLPPFPARLRWLLYGFSLVAHEEDVEMSGGKLSRRG